MLVLVYLVIYRYKQLADTGASQYICNSKPRFTEFYKDKHILALNSVDSPIRPQGYSKITLRVMKRSGQARKLMLHNVLYLLQCLINLFLVLQLLKESGAIELDCLQAAPKNKKVREICELKNLFFVEDRTILAEHLFLIIPA